MKNYRITVNGNTYDVAVDELAGGSSAPAAAPIAAAPAPAPKAAAPKANVAGTKITAPMPGKILSLKVSAGAAVKKGDVLLTFEAMKMENEMVSPKDGKIGHVAVTVGASFESGDLLLSIE